PVELIGDAQQTLRERHPRLRAVGKVAQRKTREAPEQRRPAAAHGDDVDPPEAECVDDADSGGAGGEDDGRGAQAHGSGGRSLCRATPRGGGAERRSMLRTSAPPATAPRCRWRPDDERRAQDQRCRSSIVSARRPWRIVSSATTSVGGMLPRFTLGPKCLISQTCWAFCGASNNSRE